MQSAAINFHFYSSRKSRRITVAWTPNSPCRYWILKAGAERVLKKNISSLLACEKKIYQKKSKKDWIGTCRFLKGSILFFLRVFDQQAPWTRLIFKSVHSEMKAASHQYASISCMPWRCVYAARSKRKTAILQFFFFFFLLWNDVFGQ